MCEAMRAQAVCTRVLSLHLSVRAGACVWRGCVQRAVARIGCAARLWLRGVTAGRVRRRAARASRLRRGRGPGRGPGSPGLVCPAAHRRRARPRRRPTPSRGPRARAWQPVQDSRCFLRKARTAMRLLHPGHVDRLSRLGGRDAAPQRGAGARSHQRQLVPLHRIPTNCRCRDARDVCRRSSPWLNHL